MLRRCADASAGRCAGERSSMGDVFDEIRQLIEFLWVLVTPVLGAHADGALVMIGIGLAVVLAAAIAVVVATLVVVGALAAPRHGTDRPSDRRVRAHPPGPTRARHDARPRAPGAVLA